MTWRVIGTAVLLAGLSATGCGTVGNLAGAGPGKKVPFGGVRHDVRAIADARGGDADPETEWGAKQHQQLMLVVLCAADLPFSLVGDVVTWPYARAYSYINQPTDYPPIQLAPPAVRVQPGTPAPAPPATGAGTTQAAP